MGTSISQGSPRGVSWSAVAATYRSSTVPIGRVVKEIWRAARSDPQANWQNLLANRGVLICLRVALSSGSAGEAVQVASREIARERASSLAADIAKRAVVKSFGHEDRAVAFAQALFVETSNYLVSRDLSGYVGPAERNPTVSAAISFKERIAKHIEQSVREVGRPSAEAGAWQEFLQRTVDRLSK